jgi:Zn-dependent protease
LLFNTDPLLLVINMVVLLIGMTLHEFAHSYVGYRMGDPTPRELGRLTLNPFVHINWIGWLMFAVIGFGVLGSAPIAAHRMRNPRWGFLAAVAAGPLANLAIAIATGLVLLVLRLSGQVTLFDLAMGVRDPASSILMAFLFQMIYLNILLFVFNLLPLFPMDGWHILLALLPVGMLDWGQIPALIRQQLRPLANFLYAPAGTWQGWAQASYYVLLGLIFYTIALSWIGGSLPLPNILSLLIGQPVQQITFFLAGF